MSEDNNLIRQQARYISHEIKNQLSITDVYCEVIKKNLEKLEINNESINRAINCIQKSTQLIGNSLLDLKTITNINSQNVQLNHIIEEGIELSKVYVFDKNIEIIPKLAEDREIFIDEKKLSACIINLIKNAIEAIDEKGKITIVTQNEKDCVKIIIANNGKPISKTAQKNIFDDGYTTKKEGSGIGLYLCRQNLLAQNANLELKTSTTKETAFVITINSLCTRS